VDKFASSLAQAYRGCDVITCDDFWRLVKDCRFRRWSNFALSHAEVGLTTHRALRTNHTVGPFIINKILYFNGAP